MSDPVAAITDRFLRAVAGRFQPKDFNPDQPRDEGGHWASGGSSAESGGSGAGIGTESGDAGPGAGGNQETAHGRAVALGAELDSSILQNRGFVEKQQALIDARKAVGRQEKLAEKHFEQYNALDPNSPAALKLAEKMDQDIAIMSTRVKAVMDAERDVRFGYSRALHEELSKGNEQRSPLNVYGVSDLKDTNAYVGATSAELWMNGAVGNAYIDKDHAPSFVRTNSSRASFDINKGRGNTPDGMNARTGVHELGHWIEDNRGDVKEAATGFLKSRWDKASGKEGIQQMSALVPQGQYTWDEVGFGDKFINPYVGKVYAVGHVIYATEVTSMGLEHLYAAPDAFRASDREHYHLALGILKMASTGPSAAPANWRVAQMPDSMAASLRLR